MPRRSPKLACEPLTSSELRRSGEADARIWRVALRFLPAVRVRWPDAEVLGTAVLERLIVGGMDYGVMERELDAGALFWTEAGHRFLGVGTYQQTAALESGDDPLSGE